ncbi:Esterase YbfF [Roseibaca ekhonensis]|jgi:pimeloyl-ACP methyl ester carboxylesterase|uniref:Esterase YbfF n=1 Tax=Roseinatronobacter ekhonensis TaxID=254356 RepID=A0A3B0MHH7_9RHOB|nr:alpha/beta fold hydrolase [Roseibaca ekhonensis]SUZ30587.1 Esterase YbfF [Roseibaca ekhonensis]
MRLAQVSYGTAGATPPLLVVHGLFGSARNWGAIAKRLADDRHIIAVDLRNHGESPWDDAQDYPAMAADLAELIAEQGAPMDVLGHSMGGKAAMVLALTRPELVNRLLVADIAPVAYEHTQRHFVAAMQGMDLSRVSTRAEADAALGETVSDNGVRAFLLQSLDLRAEPPRWRLNLPVLDRDMDKITGWPDDVQGRFDASALFLSGANSDYVQPEHRPAIKALFPNARFAKIPDAGHWLHAEAPRAFEHTARAWFD